MECGRWTAGVGVQEENRRGGQFGANDGEVVGGVVGEGLQLREFANDDAAQQQEGYGGDENLAEVNAVANHGEARATIHLGGRHGKGEKRRARPCGPATLIPRWSKDNTTILYELRAAAILNLMRDFLSGTSRCISWTRRHAGRRCGKWRSSLQNEVGGCIFWAARRPEAASSSL